jgi:hypothetical protein
MRNAIAIQSTPISAIAFATALLAVVPQIARAASECGVDASGQDTLTCSGASYLSGITYINSNGVTLNLDNPNMAVSGTGVSVTTPVGPVGATLAINVTNIRSITTAGTAVSVTHGSIDGLATVTIDSGVLTTTGSATTVTAQGSAGNGTGALLTMNGGQVLNTGSGGGLFAFSSGTNGTTDAIVVINGGSVDAVGVGVEARANGPNHIGTASITMSGGAVLSKTADGIWARQTAKGLAQVQMIGGQVESKGTNSDGIRASSSTGTYAVAVTGGTVIGGNNFGAAIHTSAAAGGTINIGAGAVINGGASGVALRDGDFNRDGTDETGGNATITTAGTLIGAVVLGGGTDTLTVTGGSIAGNITGDGVDVLNFNLGINSFTHGAY